jgi:hypothetical protein
MCDMYRSQCARRDRREMQSRTPCRALQFITMRREVTTDGFYVIFPQTTRTPTAVRIFLLLVKNMCGLHISMYWLIINLVASKLCARISLFPLDLSATRVGIHKRLGWRKKTGSELVFLRIDFKIIFFRFYKCYSQRKSVFWRIS